MSVFRDPLARLIEDPVHPSDEERWILFGRSGTGRLLAVMHAERRDAIRLISAREMTPKERKQHARFQG
jgi:uncharacterized protein